MSVTPAPERPVIDLREHTSPPAVRTLPKGTLVKGVGGTDTVWRVNSAGSLTKVRE